MIKKINSECKFNDNIFKMKIGTTNKKNPNTIYIELGTYITPISNKQTYSEDIDYLEKGIKTFVKTRLGRENMSKDFILIVDVADERINQNKKSYLEIQLFIKTGKTDNLSFKDLSNKFHEEYGKDLMSCIKNNLNDLGFIYSKTKK